MSAADRLIGKAHDYEVLAASHSEREALVGVGHLAAATAFTVAALVMREVAALLEDDRMKDVRCLSWGPPGVPAEYAGGMTP